MTTARTHRRNIGRGGAARPRVASPKPEAFVPVSAEAFAEVEVVTEVEVETVFDLDLAFDYDPADNTIEEVKDYVKANPQTVDAILDLELDGRGRHGLLSFLDNFHTDSED